METIKKKSKFWKDVFGIFLAVLAALMIRSFWFEPYNIPSSSMVPTLLIGDYLFITKYDYGYSRHSFPYSVPLIKGQIFAETPERGDVVIFKEPENNRTDFIKRVIGLPGDIIEMVNGQLYINHTLVPRAYKSTEEWTGERGTQTYFRYTETLPNDVKHDIYELSDKELHDNVGPFTVPEGHLFMMGDNRDNSRDSRYFGSVPFENLEGKARFIFYSNNGDGYFFQFWKWNKFLRFDRFFTGIY